MTGGQRIDAPAGAPRSDRPGPGSPDSDLIAARWRALVDESALGVFGQDVDGRCTFANTMFEAIMGISADEALGFGWHRVVHADDVAKLEGVRPVEFRVVRVDGSVRWVHAHAVPVRDDSGEVTGYLGTIDDITDRKRLEERLEYDATHDRLTGLGSRALLVEQLNAALARARRNGCAVALLFIDLDGFKRVNDMLGHAAGDELLVQVAQRLRSSVRGADLCVRIGGDEFVVAYTDMESVDLAQTLGERMLTTLMQPFDVHGHEVLVGASIGVATAQGEAPASVDQLLSNADVAAYRAKRHGRGRVELFDENLRRVLAQGRRISRSVSRLLDEPRLPLLCTPIVHLGTNRVVGFDCEVDWSPADLDDPTAVASVIEEAGMSRALDVALVRTALGQLADWEHRPPGAIVPGIGVVLTSTGALSPMVPELFRDMITRTRVDPSLCWIGMPEAAVALDLDTACEVAESLNELGVGVALRDFGAAVSSLEQLRRLPAPAMTIAGPLVAALHGSDAETDNVHSALLTAIVQYAKALGRIVMAFDVQDAAHAGRLRELGCDLGAGPAFGAAIGPDQVESFLVRRSQ